MPLFCVTVQHQLDAQTRDLLAREIAGAVAANNAALLKALVQKVLSTMSVLDDKITALQGGMTALDTSITAVAQEVADLKNAPAEPTADQLAALDSISTGLASAKSSLDALVSAPVEATGAEPVVTDPQPGA